MDLAHLCLLQKAETASHASPKVVVHGNDRVWLIFLVRCAALCRCSMVPCVPVGCRCVARLWGAIRGGRHGKLVVFLVFFLLVNAFSRSGFARHFFLEFVGCCNCRLLVGSSAFVMNRGFLWPFPDLVGGLCSCVLMLIHSLICVLFLVYAGCCRPGRRGTNAGLTFVALQGSGISLFPACVPHGCHMLAHHRARLHRAVCGRSLRHSPDVRCWRCECQCVHLLLRGCHRHEGCHSLAVLHRRGHWRPAGCSHLLFLAGWLWLVLLPRCSVPAPWVRRGVVLRAGGPCVWWLLSVSLRLLAR